MLLLSYLKTIYKNKNKTTTKQKKVTSHDTIQFSVFRILYSAFCFLHSEFWGCVWGWFVKNPREEYAEKCWIMNDFACLSSLCVQCTKRHVHSQSRLLVLYTATGDTEMRAASIITRTTRVSSISGDSTIYRNGPSHWQRIQQTVQEMSHSASVTKLGLSRSTSFLRVMWSVCLQTSNS